MIQVYSNLKQGELKLKPQNKDDLWVLSQVIDVGDTVKGRTLRKIKAGGGEERSASVVRKPVFLSISVEKVELSDTLRILGTVVEGTDDVPKGTHHSFNVEENVPVSIVKDNWLTYQLAKVKEGCRARQSPVLICVFDREECYVALMKRSGFDIIAHIEGSVQKKDVEGSGRGDFFEEIIKKISEINDRQRIDYIIIASPAFWKEDLMKKVRNEELKRKVHLASCSAVGKSAINEILKRKEIQTVMREDRTTQEMNMVEELFLEISRGGKASYGMREVKQSVDSGAVEVLMVTDGLIRRAREEGKYMELEKMMKAVDSMRGEVHLISSEHDGGRRLDGLGGVGAILRYRLGY